MPEYNFEKFQGVGNKYDERISITKSNFIGLPREFCKRYQINQFGHVELFYDSARKAIGMKFVAENLDNTYRLNYSEATRSASISARSFFRFYQIDTKKYGGKYKPEVAEVSPHGTLYVIELKEHADT